MMGKKSYLAMRTGEVTSDLISSDMKELALAAKKLANHSVVAMKLGGLGFGTSFLEWVASFAAMYVTYLSLCLATCVLFLCL